MIIRDATPQDWEVMQKIVDDSLREIVARDFPAEAVDAMRAFYSRINPFNEFDNVYCGVERDRIVATMALIGNVGRMNYVALDYENKGAASGQMLAHLANVCRSKGYPEMVGYGFKKALPFLTSQGLTERGLVKQEAEGVEFKITELFMEL